MINDNFIDMRNKCAQNKSNTDTNYKHNRRITE